MITVIRNMFVVAAALVHSAIAAEEAHTPADHISWDNKIDGCSYVAPGPAHRRSVSADAR